MLDQDLTHANDHPSTLDRVWAATRPLELSTEEFDRIWVDVQQAYDRPSTLTMTAPARARSGAGVGSSRRALAWGSLFLAQAAAVFIAVLMLPRPVGPEGEKSLLVSSAIPEKTPKVARFEVEVETDSTLVMIQLGDGTVELLRLKQDESTAMPFNGDVLADNHNDALNHWETLAR
jgi:hypothetical protein